MNAKVSDADAIGDFLGTAQNIEVGNVRLEMFVKGKGAPLLFLHGMDGVEAAIGLIDRLAERFTVYAPSHPGFGASSLPQAFDAIDDLAYFYLDLLDQLDLRNVAIAGFSFGGWIAAEMLVKNSSRVSHLVLGAPLGLRTGNRRDQRVTDIFMLPQSEVQEKMRVNPAPELTDITTLPEDRLERVFRNAEAVSLFGWSPYLYDPKLAQRLHRITLPTLILWGEEDAIAPVSYGKDYAAAIASASFATLPACGHCIYSDREKDVATRILDFIPAA